MGRATYADRVASRDISSTPELQFERVIRELAGVVVRPEVVLTEVPAPTRVAPYAMALSADVVETDPDGEEHELASGRFVVLHDPTGPEPWESTWRVVTFARATLEPEVGDDPMLNDVGWSWLTEALESHDATFHAESGTVTHVVSSGYGGLADNGTTTEVEVRASWSPSDADLPDHLRAWAGLLCTLAGLPPLPDGVVALPRPRR